MLPRAFIQHGGHNLVAGDVLRATIPVVPLRHILIGSVKRRFLRQSPVQRPPPMKMSGAVPPAMPVVIFWKELAQSV
jgi:hypothetical protein